jgi:hypothetical protein
MTSFWASLDDLISDSTRPTVLLQALVLLVAIAAAFFTCRWLQPARRRWPFEKRLRGVMLIRPLWACLKNSDTRLSLLRAG